MMDAIDETAEDAGVVATDPTVLFDAASPENPVEDLMHVLAPEDLYPDWHEKPSSKQVNAPIGHVVQIPLFGLENR